MPDFHDVRFPLDISRRAQAVVARRTRVVTLASGREKRTARWADARRRWQVGYGIKTLDDLHTVIAFFEARLGRLHGFRFRDWADWKSCPPLSDPAPTDQTIGTGDGATTTFQLIKRYGDAAAEHIRRITKPVAGSVRIAIDGTEQTSGWTLNAATGEITFTTAPASGAVITAGFEFDVPVRFDTDELRIDLEYFRAGGAPDIEIIELRP